MGLVGLLYDRAILYLQGKLLVLTRILSFLEMQEVMRLLIPVAAVLGVGIGLFGSVAAVRKHLKV